MWSNIFHLQLSTRLPCCYFELFLLTEADLKSPVANMPYTTSKYLIETRYKNTSISFKGLSPICSMVVKTKLISSGIQTEDTEEEFHVSKRHTVACHSCVFLLEPKQH